MITTQQQNRSLSQKSKCSGSFEDSYQASKTPDPAPTASDDDDGAMSYFAKLADS